MIPYLSCESAGARLEPFIDGELGIAEQVALESHLRWCAVCTRRLDDMLAIGACVRVRQSLAQDAGLDEALATMRSSVLERVRAEQAQAMPARIRRLFADRRLLWPAVGASMAVVVGAFVASGVLRAATEREHRASLAGMIDMLAHPGTDDNPMVLDGRVSLPRALDPDLVLSGVLDGDVAFAVSAVVTREGRISNYELLLSERATSRRRQGAAALDADAPAVLDAVRRSRFAPATDAGGPVAVNVVWLVTRTTVTAPPERLATVKPPRVLPAAIPVEVQPVLTEPDVPASPEEMPDPLSTTA